MTTINAYANSANPSFVEEESTMPPTIPQDQIGDIMKATFAAHAYAEWLKEVLTSDGTNPDEKYEW